MNVIQYILDLGPSVVLPLIIFILSLILRMKIGKAVRAALTIGVGFIGINLVIGLMVNTLGPAAESLVKNTGLSLPILDMGWPVAAAISFGTTAMVPWIFVLGIAVNLALIWVRFTKTLNVDMWNYWHFIFAAAFVYIATENFVLGIVIALVTEVIVLKLADMTQPIIEDYYGIPGVTSPHTDTVTWAPVGWTLNKLIDKIPGLRNLNATPGRLQERYGVIAEPLIMGTVLGLVVGAIAYAPEFLTDPGKAFASSVTLAITMGAVMLLMPRMVGLLMEGLIPLSDAAQEFMQKRFPDREVFIGLDAAILVGYPANMTVAIIMVPITLALGVGLSYLGLNQMMPFADLADLPFFAVWATTWARGNIVRGTLIETVFVAAMLSVGTFMAPATTILAQQAHFTIPDGITSISSIDSGAHLGRVT